jgi:fructose-1-phosphate kinase PfkB-like protein
MPNMQDRVANISTILRGDSPTGFEEEIQDLTTLTNEGGENVIIDLTDKTVAASLNAIPQMVFPFRALKT